MKTEIDTLSDHELDLRCQAHATRCNLLLEWQSLSNTDQTAAAVRFTGYMLGVLSQSKPGDMITESTIAEGLKYALPPWRAK